MKQKIGILGFFLLCIISNSLYGQGNQPQIDIPPIEIKYWERFFQNSKGKAGVVYMYSSRSAALDIHQFTQSTEISLSENDIESAQTKLGINIPQLVNLDKLYEYSIPLPKDKVYEIKGYELIQVIDVATPYIGLHGERSERGRFEQPSAFLNPKAGANLTRDFLSRDVESVAITATRLALEDAANEQLFVRGRVNAELELNLKNIVFFKLDKPVHWINKKVWWSWDLKIAYVWSFDASYRLGLASVVNVQGQLDELLDGGVFEDQTDILIVFLADQIDRRLFAPVGKPWFTGWNPSAQASIGTSWCQLFAGVDYESLSNGARGSSNVNSISYRVGINWGKQAYSRRPATSGRKKEIPSKNKNVSESDVFFRP